MRKNFKKIVFYTVVTIFGIFVFFYILFRFMHFSTNSVAFYFLRDNSGVRLSTDIGFEDLDHLVFSLDLTPLFNRLFETGAIAMNTSILDSYFYTSRGVAVIKDFRSDGTRLEVSFSRFKEDNKRAYGLIIGGDFPLGDNRLHREGSGMAFFDGNRWYHLWCNANEGIALTGGKVYDTTEWHYRRGRVIKRTVRDVILESIHDVELEGIPVTIRRWVYSQAGKNYIELIIDIFNNSERIISIDYAYGDEPWIGDFGTSRGDVGWYSGGIITRESYIDPVRYNFVGMWDVGNGREDGDFSGYANYIEWIRPVPTMVYISNDFHSVNEKRFLNSHDNRIINIVWKGRKIYPKSSERIHLRIGFAGRSGDLNALIERRDLYR